MKLIALNIHMHQLDKILQSNEPFDLNRIPTEIAKSQTIYFRFDTQLKKKDHLDSS